MFKFFKKGPKRETATAPAPTPVQMDRKALGQQKIGLPQAEFADIFTEGALSVLGDNNKGKMILIYYLNGMLCSHLLRLMDDGLSDENLQQISPDEVKFINAVLMRDFMRHNAEHIRPNDAAWINDICDPIIDALDISPARKAGFPQPFDLDDIMGDWAVKLSKPFGMKAFQLAMCHASMVTGPKEEGLCD